MRKNAVLFRFFTWIILAALILVNVTPAASAPLAQNEITATPPASTPLIQNEITATPPASTPLTQNEITVTPTPTQAPVNPAGAVPPNSPVGLTISGLITDASQKPLPGVTVRAGQQDTAVSAADGTYLLADLQPGRYLVSASLQGIVIVPYYRVIVLADKNATGVNFHQRQGGPASRQPPVTPAISQPGPSPLSGKIPGKPWMPPAVEQPQPLGGDMQAQAAFSLGQPGLAFRYADTYGTLEEGYPDDPAYINSPSGIFVDVSGNLLITESRGKRLLEYDSTPTRTLALGKRGVAYYDQYVFANPQDVALDKGNIWMVDPDRLVEFDSTGTFIRQVPDTNPGVAGTGDYQFNNPSGIAFGDDGKMYIADQGNQRIQVYDFAGGNPTLVHTIGVTGVTGNDFFHFNGPARVTFANGAIFVADLNNNRIMNCLVADFTCSELVLTDLVTNTLYPLDMPTGIAFGSSSLYVTDAGNYRVVKCDWDGSHATNCDHFKGVPGEPGIDDDHFLWASDVSIGPSESVYISDADNHRVQVFDSGGVLDTVHTIGAKDGSSRPAPYPIDATHFNGPAGMVLIYERDPTVPTDTNIYPYLYFTENRGQRLVKLSLKDTPPTVVWAVGQPGVYGADDLHFGAFWGGSQGNLDRDSKGRIYVPDTANHRVLIYLPNGSLWAAMGETGVPGTDNQHFNQPAGVSLDNDDNLYVADSGNDRVQVFDSNRNYLATLGETGVAGYDGGHFNWPLGVSVDSSGNIFVADTNNQRVQKCTLSGSKGNCLPFAGKTGVSAAGFDYLTYPTAVLVAQNEIYILDAGRNRVLVFDPNGAYRTSLVGDWGSRSGGMRGGLGIAVGAYGDVYVSDPINQRIQKYLLKLPADGALPGWSQLNLNGFGKQYVPQVQAVASFPPYLYAADYNSLTQVAELSRMDSNGNWSQVMNNGFGNSQNQAIDDLAVFNNVLYASTENTTTGGQLYSSMDGTSWTQLTLPGLDAWDAELYMMQGFNGKLYIGSAVYGSGAPPQGARIFSCDASVSPPACSLVFEAPSGTNAVLSMAVVHDSLAADEWLYAGMVSQTGGQIYRCSAAACALQGDWLQVFTDGNGSADNAMVSSLAAYNISGTDQIFAGVANKVHGARVFEGTCDDPDCLTLTWTQVNTDGFGSNENTDINALEVYGSPSELLAVTHNETTGLQIWGYNATGWGTSAFLSYPGFGNSTNYSAYSAAAVANFLGRLVVGTENLRNGGGVWASDPATYKVEGIVTGLTQTVYLSITKNGVQLQNNPATLDVATGYYTFTFTSMPPGDYVVAPFSSSFSFAPRSWDVTVVDQDVTEGVDFAATFRPLPLVKPIDRTRLTGQATSLAWVDISVKQYEYQLSYQENFSSLVKTGKVKTNSVTLTALPLNKTFFWRVRDASSSSAPGVWSMVWTFSTPNPPSVPVLVSPATKSFLQNLAPTFMWKSSTNSPGHYRIQVSQSTAFNSMDLDENTIGAATTYQLEAPLTPNRTYYWRVQSVSANGDFSAWSATWLFITYPETPWLVLPNDSAVASSLKPTFQWNDSTNTGAYQIQIRKPGGVFTTVDVITKYYTLTSSLVPYIQYGWRVRARGVGGYGTWSAIRVLFAPNPPGSTTLVAPAANAILSGYQPVFSWKTVSGAPHYELQVATDATFPFGNLRMDRYVDSTSYDMSTNPYDSLDSNRAFYWRVAACNAQYQCGSYTAANKLYTRPGTPALKSPDDIAFVSSLGVTFTWDDLPSPAQPINSSTFTLEIDKNNDCTGVSKTSTVKARTFTTVLAKGAYYWHVKAAGLGGSAGASSWSMCYSLTVEVPPAAPSLTSPANNGSVADYRNILFKWTAPSGAPVGYEIQASRDSTFASVDLDKEDIDGSAVFWQEDGNAFIPPYIWGGGTYYWRMRSKNAHNLWGNWSANRKFVTLSTIYGYVTDVTKLNGINDVTVDILQGTGTTPILPVNTDEEGYFIINNVPKGSTTVRITKAGFITTSLKVNITGPSQNLLYFGFVPLPAPTTPPHQYYSFVLTWPASPTRNLDMHLWTPDGTKRMHIYPYNEGSISATPFVHMDAANNAYNTEVITVDRDYLVTGNYILAVDQVSPTTSSPKGSGARLEIYDETGALVMGAGPYTITTAGSGGWWHILDFSKIFKVTLDFTTTAPAVFNKVQATSPAPWTGDKGIFGYVWLEDSMRGFANIDVSIDGAPRAPTTAARTDISGLFMAGGLTPGNYAVTPSAAGFTAAPVSQNVNVSSVDPQPNFPWFFSNYYILTPTSGVNPGGEHRAVATQGHFTYLASGPSLDIFNIADKTNPVLVKRFQPSMGKINDLALAGNFAFLASDDGLNIIDISDPANAYNAGYYLDYGGPTGVAVKGRYAYLVYGWADLVIVDINDFITGVSEPQVKYISEFHIAGYAEKIAVSGNYAYIAYGDTGSFRGLYVVNIADPLHPQGVGFASVSGYPIGVVVSGNYAYLVGGVSYDYTTGAYTGGKMDVFNINNPSMPRQIIEMTFTDPVYNAKVVGGDVYLANGAGGQTDGTGRIIILDTSNPMFGVDLLPVSTFASAYPAFCVDVLDKFAYVGSQDAPLDPANSKMEVVSIANKTAPTLLGSIIPSP